MKPLPDHTPATLGDVRAVSLAALLAQAEEPCTTGCSEGTIWNTDAQEAWRAEHAEALEGFQQERRRTRSAWVSPEETALRDTEPPMYFDCACNGTGFILAADGRALLDFLTRHRVVRASGRYVPEPGPHILPLNATGGTSWPSATARTRRPASPAASRSAPMASARFTGTTTPPGTSVLEAVASRWRRSRP